MGLQGNSKSFRFWVFFFFFIISALTLLNMLIGRESSSEAVMCSFKISVAIFGIQIHVHKAVKNVSAITHQVDPRSTQFNSKFNRHVLDADTYFISCVYL